MDMDIDIHSLKIFCKVVEKKSFTNAAKALYLTQPTISAHISKLEERFGVKLLDRLGKEIHPTKSGIILYQYGDKILKIKDDMVQSIHSYLGNISGELILGASTIPGEYILPEFVTNFQKERPGVKIIVEIENSSKIIEMVASGKVELGFVGTKHDRLASEYFSYDHLVLIISPVQKLTKVRQNIKSGKRRHAKRDMEMEIDIHDLSEELFIMREMGSGTREAMEKGLEKAGFSLKDLKVVCELGSTEAVKQAVMGGVGVAIVSDRAIKNEVKLGLLRIIKLKNLNIKRNFYLIYNPKRTLSPIAQSFIQFIKDTKTL